MGHGLSNREAVRNMQLHIAEYGPIYMSFQTTNEFMGWDWAKHPVYTGGASPVGGHAVIAAGWGVQGHDDYWLIRNSWGSGWAEKGYCKFKRGVNLDDIESREVGTVLPETPPGDAIPPECQLTNVATSLSYLTGVLYSLNAKLSFRCSEAATLKMWVSNRLANQEKSTVDSAKFRSFEFSATAGEEATQQVDLLCGDFGLVTGDMMVHVVAEDAAGNKGTIKHFIQIRRIPGMQTAKPCLS